MLSLLARRLFDKLIPLAAELGQTDDLDSLIQGGFAWMPSQRNLPYEVLLELDAFVYEFRSAYEILGRFLSLFSREILGQEITEDDLLEVLKSRGIDTGWAKDLQERRKFLFHEHAPWLAYQVAQSEPLDATPIFLAHVDADPGDPTEAISTKDLGRIYAGFDKALGELQQWAMKGIAGLEA
jgi:hypothetical protein